MEAVSTITKAPIPSPASHHQNKPDVNAKEDAIKMLPPVFCQAKLTVGAPDDPLEKEADDMADKVMRMPMADPISFSSGKNIVSRKCAECEKEKKLHRKESSSDSTSVAPPIVYDVLNSSGGKALDADTRAYMEPRFNYDFSNVKIHDNDLAVKSASSINALAYTSGNNVVFNSGQYNTNSDSGKRLLAHELTHVVQQGNAVMRQSNDISPISSSSANPEVSNLPSGRYVDAFVRSGYNLDYRSEGGNLSKWLQLEYYDGIIMDLNIDEISISTVSSDVAMQMRRQATIGRAGRIFPQQMNASTVPRLANAKRSAIETMEEYNYEFMLAALPAILFIIFAAAGTTISRPTRTTPRLPRIRGTAPALTPSQMGRLIGEEVRTMASGKRAAIVTRVSGLRLSQSGAVEAANAASEAAFGRTAIVNMADGTIVVSSVQVGANQPIFIVLANGVVQAARATIAVGENLALSITNIVVGL